MENKSIKNESYTILDGKVHIFKRDGSPFWWAGIHHKGKYLRTSTKKKDKGGAEAIAQQWFFNIHSKILSGEISSPKHNFETVSKSALTHYQSLVDRKIRSETTLEGIKGVLNSRVLPFFKNYSVQDIDNTLWHKFKENIFEQFPQITRGSLHQYKNALRVVLNESYRLGHLKTLPIFKDEYGTRKSENARPWFTETEYLRLHTAIRNHAKKLEKIDKRQYEFALELYDFVIFSTNTGMRVGELQNCKISDVKIVVEKLTNKEILIIQNIKGKRGGGSCQSFYGAVKPFRSILQRRNIQDPSKCDEKLFLVHHRNMFNKILESSKLKYTNTEPKLKRDFISLRATYICFRLLNGAPIYEIANNCRTSVSVIQEHYAKRLGGQLMKNINRVQLTEGWDF